MSLTIPKLTDAEIQEMRAVPAFGKPASFTSSAPPPDAPTTESASAAASSLDAATFLGVLEKAHQRTRLNARAPKRSVADIVAEASDSVSASTATGPPPSNWLCYVCGVSRPAASKWWPKGDRRECETCHTAKPETAPPTPLPRPICATCKKYSPKPKCEECAVDEWTKKAALEIEPPEAPARDRRRRSVNPAPNVPLVAYGSDDDTASSSAPTKRKASDDGGGGDDSEQPSPPKKVNKRVKFTESAPRHCHKCQSVLTAEFTGSLCGTCVAKTREALNTRFVRQTGKIAESKKKPVTPPPSPAVVPEKAPEQKHKKGGKQKLTSATAATASVVKAIATPLPAAASVKTFGMTPANELFRTYTAVQLDAMIPMQSLIKCIDRGINVTHHLKLDHFRVTLRLNPQKTSWSVLEQEQCVLTVVRPEVVPAALVFDKIEAVLRASSGGGHQYTSKRLGDGQSLQIRWK